MKAAEEEAINVNSYYNLRSMIDTMERIRSLELDISKLKNLLRIEREKLDRYEVSEELQQIINT